MLTKAVAFVARSLCCCCTRNNAVTRPSTQSNSEELEKAGKEDSGIIRTFALHIKKDQLSLSRVEESFLT